MHTAGYKAPANGDSIHHFASALLLALGKHYIKMGNKHIN
jgi:hypothetical protein